MGFIGNLSSRIRSAFRRDKSRAAMQISKGATSAAPHGSFDLLQSYGHSALAEYLKQDQDILTRYVDYSEMNEYPLVSAALDLFADDASQTDIRTGRALWITSKNERIAEIGDKLFHKTLRIDEELWEIARTSAHMGNDYEEILVTNEGVIGLNYLPPETMRRIEGPRGELFGFIQDFTGKIGYTEDDFKKILDRRFDPNGGGEGGQYAGNSDFDLVSALEDWEVVHFRLRGSKRRSCYGLSQLEAARWIWKRLTLLEDAAFIYRLQRAPERFAYYVEIGDLPPPEALGFLNKVRQQNRKKKYINPATGKIDLKFDIISPSDDIYIPVRKGEASSKIEVLGAPSWQCLAGETKVPLLDGSSPTIKELSEREGEYWVYSVDKEGHIVPGRAHSARISNENAEVYEVVLDNDEKIVCTGNHPFLSRNGEWILAENLSTGTSLMPLYKRTSDKKLGDYLHGYEQVYDPSRDKYVYTHHAVYESIHGSPERLWKDGKIIHHVNHSKLDNRPDNLQGLSRKEHGKEHAEYVKYMHTPEAKERAAAAKRTPQYRKKVRALWKADTARQALHKARMVAHMSDPKQHKAASARLTAWNQSADHIQRVTGKKNARWVEMNVAQLAGVVSSAGAKSMRDLISRKVISQNVIEKVLKAEGITWSEFARVHIPGWVAKGRAASKNRKPVYKSQTERNREKQSRSLKNHKVVSVRKLDVRIPVYDLTVDEHHNFAIDAGVIVHNSVDDLEYFRQMMFAALKIPKAYLGMEEGVVRAVLSAQDVRFCRTILRLQSELKTGFDKVLRVHLSALGLDPFSEDYQIQMTVPSSIFELAQIEAENAKADLCARLGEFVSHHWMLSKILGFSDDDIELLFQQKKEDAVRIAEYQGEAQAKMQEILGASMEQNGVPPPGEQGGAAPPQGPQGPSGSPKVPPPPGAEALVQSIAKQNGAWIHGNGRPVGRFLSEKALFEGSRAGEQRAEAKLEKLLKNDLELAGRMKELSLLLSDLRQAMPRKF